MYKRKRIVIALGGNALGNTLPEQMQAVKTTATALSDLIEEGHQVVVVHGNGPQVGMINNAMAALSREDANHPNTPLSVCVAMSQAYIGCYCCHTGTCRRKRPCFPEPKQANRSLYDKRTG